jgi:HK97 family phage major capsid protein
LAEQLLGDMMRDVDAAGVFLRLCPPIGVNSLSGGTPKGTNGVTVYHPQFGSTCALSTMGFGRNDFNLIRYVAAVEVDGWMLASELAVALAEYVREELVYGLALATDTEWFMGDGSATYGNFTGLFKLASGVKTVTGDSGDDTFAKITAKTTYYLSKMRGELPDWAWRSGAAWIMHPTVFFPMLGVRDSGGMPIVNIMLAQPGGVPLWLMGAPVELTTTAPSVTAVSTPFMLLAALKRACRTYRHNRAIEFKMSDQLGLEKWIANLNAFAADVPMDRVIRNGNGLVQLITHS